MASRRDPPGALRRALPLLVALLTTAGRPSDRSWAEPPVTESIDSLVAEALLQTDEDVRESLLLRADSVADQWVMEDPGNADALYWRSVAAGLLAETAGPREKIRLGTRSMEYAEAALAADSTHAGAHHVLGRIHSGVKRLGWLTRLIGGRLGMGPLIEAATWEDAAFHLRRARELDPDDFTFRLEYAVTLRDMGRREDAAAELALLLAQPAEAPIETAAARRACRILVDLDAGPCPADLPP